MSPLKLVDCVVFGGTLVEQVVQVPRLPRPRQDNVPLARMERLPGGTGANVAVYLARLGASVRLLDRWGDDPEADLLESALKREGVDIHFCQRQPGLPTPFMIILTLPDHDWTGITRIPDAAQLGAREFPSEAVASGRFLHLHGFCLSTKAGREGAAWAVDAAVGEGVQISMDACTPVALESPDAFRRFLPFCRVFFANSTEAQALTGKDGVEPAARELLSLGPEAVVIKAGRDGCFFVDAGKGELRHLPAVPTRIVDTIGAGDAVVAGVIAGLIRRMTMEDSLRLGMAAAALTCQGMGAQSRFFTAQEACDLAGIALKQG